MTAPGPHNSVLPSGVRLDFLDALRGLAALYVVIYHMVLIPEPDLVLPRWAHLVAHNGGMGVTLFFVVSAFSLFYTMPLRQREPRPWVSFFLHRFFRIAPLFYLWIALTLVRDKLMFNLDHGPFEIATSATFLFNLVPQRQEGFVWASWTIGIEMLFYAAFPLFYCFAKNRWKALTLALWLLIAWTAIQGLLAYFPVEDKTKQMFTQWSFLRHLPVFACGAIAYHLFMPSTWVAEKPHELGLALATSAVALFMALVNGWLPPLFGDQYYWQAVIFTLLLLGLGWSPVKLVVNRVTSYMGRISYSMYLNHPTVVLLLSPVYVWIYRQQLGLTVSFLACLAVTLVVVIVMSELTYRFVEEPGIRLGKRINKALRQRSSVAVTIESP